MNKIRVSDNRRFLVREDGSPFFYLGDTAWELFHRLNLGEATQYLAKRAQQRFTVVQAVVLGELDGLHNPNANGDLPLEGDDPTKPLEPYFGHVDAIVREANRLGLTVGMLPTWGDKWNRKWGKGPEIFDAVNARVFGEILGRRYRDADLIWILGGDRPIEEPRHLEIARAMADGLRAGDGGSHLISFHPMGGGHSSEHLHQEPWLDFNMIQSGHGARNGRNWEMIARDYLLEPTKPCMDAEPCYENHPVNWKPEELGWFDEYDVRKAAYRSLFAGSHGHTYGCNDVWQMHREGDEPVGYSRNLWSEVLGLPGANQMRHVRALMESRPFLSRIPDQTLVLDDPDEAGEHIQATRCDEGSYAFVYLPKGGHVALDLQPLHRLELDAAWYSPRTGDFTPIGRYSATRAQQFEAPSPLDWVLVLDDPNAGFEPPSTE
ncbi:MAG TPA: glycoside hydrolase family 140 protein [Fimbriimonas sp.]